MKVKLASMNLYSNAKKTSKMISMMKIKYMYGKANFGFMLDEY